MQALSANGKRSQAIDATADRFDAVVGTRRGLGPPEATRRRVRELKELQTRLRARVKALEMAMFELHAAYAERDHLRDDIALIERTLPTSSSRRLRQQLASTCANKRLALADNEHRINVAEDEVEALATSLPK